MIRFNNDYNHGAHPEILKALQETNTESYGGYSRDPWCEKAREVIRQHLNGADVDIHFMIGGTQVNAIALSAFLRPYQSIISATNGHINLHEAGAIEHTGHKIVALPAVNGKLTADLIAAEAQAYHDSGCPEYMTEPKLVFLSSPSEYGTTYTKAELEDIRQVCDQYGLYLYLDGARLGYWLSASDCDVTLADLARLTDAFYIGGTKCGCLMGEALIIVNSELRHGFWTATKQSGGVLAKGWLLGLQFYTLFKDDLYFSITRQADELATQMETAFVNAGLSMYTKNTTNQKFVILSNEQAEYLGKSYIFEFDHKVDDEHICVRFCTSWSTETTEVQQLVKDISIMK